MSDQSDIQWTNSTWNPVTGCTHKSAGCDNCYAVRQTYRLECMGQEKYAGLTVLNQRGERHFNGVVRCHEDALQIPLRWKKPRMIFVNSMSDLFHKDVPFDFVDKVFAVMALCPQHTFQILTKRPERMAEYFSNMAVRTDGIALAMHDFLPRPCDYEIPIWQACVVFQNRNYPSGYPIPLPNVWLGTSCENQATANERIPHLLKCPAAVRFISAEPLLGPIDLAHAGLEIDLQNDVKTNLDWVIVGGESGKGARPFDVQWARDIIEQCAAAGVSVFCKQLGSVPVIAPDVMDAWPNYPKYKQRGRSDGMIQIVLRDGKGGDPDEWAEDLRVRQIPAKGLVTA